MKLRHRLIYKLIKFMGAIYVWLDSKLPMEKGPILGLEIDDDFEGMTRRELCNHVENKFRLEKDSFWNLDSTPKIRFCCQMARNILSPSKFERGY